MRIPCDIAIDCTRLHKHGESPILRLAGNGEYSGRGRYEQK